MESAFFGASTSVDALFDFERRKDKVEIYEKPEIEIIYLNTSDIVTASGGNDIGEDGGENDGEWM